MKSRVIKSIRNIAISTICLLALIVVTGVAYTWFNGRNTVQPAPSVVTTDPPVTAIKRRTPAPNAPVSASIQSITSPVSPGSNASITIRTTPEADCTITVVYDKTASKDSGLKLKKADGYGMNSWTWTVEDTVPIGKWPVTVTCAYNKKSAVVIGDLNVVKTP